MKISLISDTHRDYKKLKIPEADVLIHCGDLDCYEFSSELKDFNKWLATVPCKYKIIIAGNHDGFIKRIGKEETRRRLTNGIYLENSGIEIEGIKFWGSPYTPIFNNWYFMLSSVLLKRNWENIPKDTDILITHGPPHKILDYVECENKNVGCTFLADKIKELKIPLHVFGHIHSQYGVLKRDKTIYINCSVMDEDYNIVNKPIVINYPFRFDDILELTMPEWYKKIKK